MTVDAQTTQADDITEVEIFGAVYRVRGRDDGGHLQEVAALVDSKMREVSGHARTADTAKLAILAALNLADELLQNRTRQQGERVEIKERVTALTGELAEALVR